MDQADNADIIDKLECAIKAVEDLPPGISVDTIVIHDKSPFPAIDTDGDWPQDWKKKSHRTKIDNDTDGLMRFLDDALIYGVDKKENET